MLMLHGENVVLRPATLDDLDRFEEILSEPGLENWLWDDPGGDIEEDADKHFAIMVDDEVIGMIQWWENDDPEYRHAGVDLFLATAAHGRGHGTDAVRTMCRWLVSDRGHHRLTIDPMADNKAAIRCYEKVGFKPVGVMRQYALTADGGWADGLLMDLLAAELA